jgi:signal transduction histidine kinase
MGRVEALGDTQEPSKHGGFRESPFVQHFEGFMARYSSGLLMATGLLLLLAIWALDVLTGPRVAPSLFYMLPVLLVTWRLGAVPGITVAFLSAAAWVGGDVMAHEYPLESWITVWDASVRFTLLAIVAMLHATIRGKMQRERNLAAHSAALAVRCQEANDMKDTLLHAVSHELKSPITAILGSVQSLQRREQLQLTPEQEDDLLEGVLGSGQKLNRLIDDLLDFQRLDRGVTGPDRRFIDLGAMARSLVAEADYLGQHPTRVVADAVEVSVDGPKAERILENLLRNAAKHTPPGTPIIVRAEEDRGGVLLSVEDEGPGVPDEMKDAIFEPFRQGSEARARRLGTGLGLSLVEKFAGLHAGSAWVEDRPGGGSVFRVYLSGEVRRLTG